MKANIFDSAFSDLIVKSPPKANQKQVSDEAWGDIDAQFTYKDQYRPSDYMQEQTSDPVKPQGPTQSKVVQKYFKPVQKRPAKAAAPPKTIDRKAQELINAQMEELEREVAKLKKGKEQIKRVKTSIEDRKVLLQNQKKTQHDNTQASYAELRSWKEREIQKLQKEAKARERNQKQLSALPTKKDRAKIEEIKAEIKKVAEETKKKESRHKFALERMTKQIEDLTEKNQELKREVGTKPEPAKNSPAKENKPSSITLSPVKRSPVKASSPVKNSPTSDYSQGLQRSPTQGMKSQRPPVFYDEDSVGRAIDENIDSPRQHFQSETNQHIQGNETFSDSEEDYKVCITYPTAQNENTPPSSDSENEQDEYDQVIEKITLEDGKERTIYKSGLQKTIFPNGTVKEIHTDSSTKVYFPNGDILQTLVDNKQIYTYAESGIIQENYPSGLQIFTFVTGQVEAHHPDGTVQVTFPDGSQKFIPAEGDEIVQN